MAMVKKRQGQDYFNQQSILFTLLIIRGLVLAGNVRSML